MQTLQSMKHMRLFKLLSVSILLSVSLLVIMPAIATAQPVGTCADKIDNDGDGRIDWTGGIDAKGNTVPPDPSCINASSNEVADEVTGASAKIIPCVNKCDLGSVLQLLNNVIEFLIKVLLFPVAIAMFMYAGYQYIISQGQPVKKVNVKRMVGKLILGILLILCSWVIVKTLLVSLGYTDTLYFFEG